MSNILLRRFGQGMAEIEGREEEQRRRAALSPAPQPEMVPAPEKEVDILGERFAQGLEQIKQSETPGYLGTFGKGFKSELTMGYGVSDEPPQIEGVGKKIAYGAGALAGMIPSFIALSTVTTPLGSAALKLGSIGRLVNTLHKVGKVYKIADKAGKARNVTKLGMAVEGAAKSGALFAAHGAVHELPPGEEGTLARAKAGAEAVPMGMAFGAAAPLAGGRRLAQIGTAAGIGAGATAIGGGTTEDILIQGGLLGAMSALHISVKDAHSFAKQIAGEVDKLPAEQKGAKIAEILDATREDRLDFARAKAEVAPSETDLIREDRLSFAQERAKDQPMGVPGDLPAPEKSRLPGRGVVLGEEPRSVSELLTAEGRPVSEAAEHERIVGALDTEGALRDAIQAVKVRDLKRQEGLIEVPGTARRPAGPEVGVRGAFGMRARPEPLVEPAGVPEERFIEAEAIPDQVEAGRPEAEALLEQKMLKELKENPAQIKDILENPRAWSEQWIAVAERLKAEGRIEPEPEIPIEPRPEIAEPEKMSLPELLSAHEKGGAFNVENKAPETTWGEPCRAKFEDLTGEKWSPEIVKEAKKGIVPKAKIPEKPVGEVPSAEPEILPGVPEKEIERPIAVVPEKPKPDAIAIPELKNTEDALAFGKIATPEQIETLKVKQNESLAKTDILKAEGDLQGAMDEAVRGQFFREAIGSSEGKVAMAPPAPPMPPKPIEPAVEAKPKTEEPEIISTPEGKEVFVPMPIRKAEKLSPRKQKAYLAAEVDKAIEAAPDVPDMPRIEVPSEYTKPEKYVSELAEMAAKHKVEINTLLGQDKAYVTIRVPGDGEFTIVNEKSFLKRFKDQIKKFPITAKPKGPAAFFGKPRPSTKPTGKRITGEDVEYYNEFKARKQNLIEREPHPNGTPKQSYGNGFFTDGHYAVKLPEKPKTKKPISTGKKAPDIKTVIPTEGLKEAEMMGEFRGPWPDEAATIAHVIAKDGTEIFLNAKYVDSILTKYPKAKPYAVEAGTNVVFKEGKETVGLVMSMRMEMPEFLKTRAAEVAGVKPKEVVGEKTEKAESLSETKSRLLENIKSEKGSSELINDLSRLGADAIKRGHKSFKAFAVEMKAVLGNAWAKVKHLIQRAYAGSKKILASEKGAWTIKKGKEKALKAIGIEPGLKEGEPLPKRARSIGLESPTGKKVYLDVSKEAKELAVELGLSYPKEVVTHKEIELEADRIMKSDEQLQEVLSKARKEQKLSNPEMLVVRRVNATALETFTDVFKTGKPDEINKKLQTYKEGIFKTTQDLHRQRGQDLNALKIQVQASPDAISNAFAGLKRDLRPQDIDLYDTACKAMKLGNDKPMVSFMKYLEKTKADPELMDYVYEYWYNCILSGIPTHVVNVASNTAWAAWQVGVHRPLLAAIDPIVAKFQKRPTEYYLDEIVPMLAGIRKGYKPGAEAAKEIMTKGYTTEASMDKWALDMGKTIGAFARSPNKHLRQIAPFLTIPTKALRAMDVWANQMGYQAELGAICKRMEKQGKGKFEDLMQSPTEEMQKEAAEYAAYTTFMNEPGKLTKWLEKGRDIVPGGRFVMPFVRTIANLTKRGVEMTPGLGIVLGRKATGREVTQVAVKQIEGAMIALALASMVADDRITGNVPADKAEREAFYRQGKLPWAIKIGGRWRQFRRLEPFNGPIAAVAIAHDAWKKTGEVPSTELAFRCTMGIVDNILDSSYLSGLTQVLDSVRRSDTAPQKIANMFDRTVASFSPMSSFQRSFVRAFEAMEGEGAIVRKPKGVAETIKAITPIISREVAAKKNIWGKEVVIPGSPLEQWLPWKAARPTKDVVELEIERLHGKTGLPYPGMPAKYMTVRGERIDLTDKQYDHLLVEGGQAAKKRLDRLVGTGYWKTMSDKEKTARIKRILSDSRKVARSKLKRELGGAVTIPGTGPRYKPKGFVPAAFTGRAFTPAKFEHAGF